MGVANRIPIVTNGLVLNLDAGNYKSYNKTGTTWTDLSVNKNNGTLINGPVYNPENGGYFSFDGVNDYASVSSTNLVVNTFSIWMNLKTLANGPIIYSGVDEFQSGLWEWSIYIFNGTIYFRPNSGDLGPVFYLASNYLNKWKNFTIIRNFNSNFYLYEDGFYKNEAGIFGTNNTNQLRFCKGGGNYTSVNIANVTIYNRALSAQEISQNFMSQKSRFGL